MTLQITIIGLDKTGISFGLALANVKEKLFRCAHDPFVKGSTRFETQAAFEKVFYRLNEAVHDADIILLSLPADQVEITIKDMAEDLKPGSIVIDTSRNCVEASKWAINYLPAGVHFISMIPAINGLCLRDMTDTAARADLFTNSEMVIATTHDTHADAATIASEISTIVGSHACLTDIDEADGLFARIDLMPKLASAAVLLATLEQPGWDDAKRFASYSYMQITDTIQFFNEHTNPAAELINNRDNTLRALDDLTTSLAKIRQLVELNDTKRLDAVLLDLKESQSEWSDLRASGNWDKSNRNETTKPGSIFTRLFGSPLKNKK